MTTVGVSGAAGRMGRLVAAAVRAADDLELVACYDPAGGGDEIEGVPCSAAPDAVAGADVVVEFTRPDVVLDNLALWHAAGSHAIVGTSGFDAAKIAHVETMWPEGPPNCLIVPNFSIGAVVMMRIAEIAAPHFPAAEVIELHHDAKADAPSGTSIATAGRIAAAQPDQRRVADSAELFAGARGGNVDGVPIHSVRLPGFVAHQQVLFGSTGETLSIRHDTSDRNAFMPGVVLAIRSIGDLADPVTVGLESLLGI